MNETSSIQPWYKQFWPWFLIAFPLTAVIGSMITIKIAFTDKDGLVKDDYYKQGLAMNQDKARKRYAENLGLEAQGRVNVDTGSVTIILNDAAIGHYDKLNITMIHPTRSHNDMSIPVHKSDNNTYVGHMLHDPKPGHWWIRLSPEVNNWYIEGRVKLPENQALQLK
jgi:hypothetical protein